MTLLLLVFVLELVALGYLIYEVNVYSQRMASFITSIKTYIETKEVEVDAQLNAAKIYVAELEKKINEKFGPYL